MSVKWTEEEKDIVKKYFPSGGVLACASRLPGRSKGSIKSLSFRLGLRSSAPRIRRHTMVGTRTYRAWYSAKQRCRNPNNQAFGDYGGNGIEFCERWDDFLNFVCDMGEAPSDKHQIDRIDSSKGYFPENCRWVTPQQNSVNTMKKNKTGFRGVSILPSGRFRALIRPNGNRVDLGVYDTAEEAAEAYDDASMRFFGSHGMTNKRIRAMRDAEND